MVDFAPGMRTIIRDEEWMIKKIETNSLGNKTLYCVGVSPLVKDREAIFLADLEQIQVVDPAEVKLVADYSPFYKRALLYLESQWRQQIPTDSNLHIGHRAAIRTRAKEKLKIYWSSETMQEVVAGFSVDTSRQKSLAIIKEKLKQDKNT